MMTSQKTGLPNEAIKSKEFRRYFGAESMGGATNAAGALGNGKLTVGISPWSELIYFRWPTLSYYDHLRYYTKARGLLSALSPKDMRWGKDAPSLDWHRYGRPYDVYPGAGARGGISLSSGNVSWFGDSTWTSSRRYEPPDGPIICTTVSRQDAKVEICQWLDQNSDLLVQEYHIESSSASKFFYYGTFAPTKKLDRGFGVPDSKKHGFAGTYLPDHSIILYFQPNVKDKGRISSKINTGLSAAQIDDLFPERGTFIAMSLTPSLDGFQVGADRRGRSVSRDAPIGASENAITGSLDSNIGYIGQIDAGFEYELDGGENDVTVLIGVADTAESSVKIIEAAQKPNLDKIKKATINYWLNLSKNIEVPQQAKETEKILARRQITNLFIGRDPETGAIVAAPTRQPAYRFDWPRDGAFYDLALDFAGFPEIVSHHLEFYRRFQRKKRIGASISWLLRFKSPFYSPKGHWDAILFTDGRKGALSIIPFEIDETSLILWDLWRHEQFVPSSEQASYQKTSLGTLTLAANAITSYVNKRKGWNKRAFEDDNIVPTATLHGASSILMGLASAIDAGRKWGGDTESIDRWKASAIALREGILRRIEDKSILGKAGWRGIRWALFPAPVFETYEDSRAQTLIDALITETEEKITQKRLAYSYLAEDVYVLCIAAANDPNIKPLLSQAVDVVVNQLPIPGTNCYGENTILISMPDSPKYLLQQRVSIPHLWNGVCAYLCIEAFYRPERFLSQIPPIPK